MIKKLGRYQILDVLGRGSMGVVYKGMDPQIHKIVAIKTMNQKILQQPEMQERFYREGAILGQLQHKNIISVYNAGEDGDIYYIAMEYLEGVSLDRLIQKDGKLPIKRALEIVKQVCEGVHAAHRQSVIHRDLKPANIFLLEEDHVKVLDFGVAHFQNSQLTNSGMLLGTINYIAPEQITGLRVDYRADIFSLGVILYELLAERNPFLGKNISQTMVKIVNENPPPIAEIPEELGEILEKALHKDRNLRYISAQLMALDLDRVLRTHTFENSGKVRKKPSLPRAESGQDTLFLNMIEQSIAKTKNHFRKQELAKAEAEIKRLARLDKQHPAVGELRERLEKAHRQEAKKKQFAEQLVHESLLKANEKLNARQFVLAIELCDKALKLHDKNQDAKVLRANCLRKLEHFLKAAKQGEA